MYAHFTTTMLLSNAQPKPKPNAKPKARHNHNLKAYNSLTKTCEQLHLNQNQRLNVYLCGITPNKPCHAGHLRLFITVDIMKRILTDYFDIPVKLTQNITDIDDKLIIESDLLNIDTNEQRKEKIKNLVCKHVDQFDICMEKLHIQKPDCLCKVTDHVQQMIKYIENLIDNKCAYHTKQGNVYFDSQYFEKHHPHTQSKFLHYPHNFDQLESLDNQSHTDKKHFKDFVLWKTHKDNEPFWISEKWGKGRPSWHCECSCLINTHVGSKLDVHIGATDLMFPHHHNEIQLAEAFHGYTDTNDKWVQQFWHVGCLNVDNQKMSKSLNNFITIKEIMKLYSPTEIRLYFLMHAWNKSMNWSKHEMISVQIMCKYIDDFFKNTQVILKSNAQDKIALTCKSIDIDINELASREVLFVKQFDECNTECCNHLQNNFSYTLCMNALQGLIKNCNIYAKTSQKINCQLYKQVSKYIFDMLSLFGIYTNNFEEYLQSISCTSLDTILNCVCESRWRFRNTLKNKKSIKQDLIDILSNIEHKIQNFACSQSENESDKPHTYNDIFLMTKQLMSNSQELIKQDIELDLIKKNLFILLDRYRDIEIKAVGIILEDKLTECVWKLI